MKLLICTLGFLTVLATAQAQTPSLTTAKGQELPSGNASSEIKIDSHVAKYDEYGHLLPWIPWGEAIDREMEWYLNCPWENGYPRFVAVTFMNGDYQPSRRDTIPAMQNGMGIISYLKYYHWKKQSDPRVLKPAGAMGEFLV